ncbi:hypothetical protein IMG5_048920 [Ichthyophthirius multifiliis]|uniref:Transmembrane protein n=1 Tax=Ichthyophthirius multifiliis TaxID=5932 RepID=G0QMH9_ICHMU|nr:hypothetical protein IMG5_048920 [Ichthyophthirius multifiliis]EGR33575.1 hypothetical protein IMG5_048920 [Ichthyophthirius multifiliis]|eukprot:XP_004037561.1 hypothetical protein IMG5_048920 [Ichthyophthirius multifiliis]
MDLELLADNNNKKYFKAKNQQNRILLVNILFLKILQLIVFFQKKGKTSPGPAYNIRGSDTFIFKNNPEWVIGTQQRNTLNTGAKYDYYLRQDKDFYPNNADVNRRSQPPNVKIGLELRFQNDPRRQRGTPGPQYNPSFRYDQKNPPKFTFGQKREVAGQSPLVYMGSTPNLVGPGSYILKNVPKTSKIQNEPKYSIPKAKRFVNQNQNWSISHINQPQNINICKLINWYILIIQIIEWSLIQLKKKFESIIYYRKINQRYIYLIFYHNFF